MSQSKYMDDTYCKEFEAMVIQAEPYPGGRYAIQLDSTYFYPTGGGQEHDTGFIGSTPVIDVIRDELSGQVLHIVESEIPRGSSQCKINWDKRFRNMQHHTGQHTLSQCALRLFGLMTLSANINAYTPSTIDLGMDRLLSISESDALEDLANQVIYENRPVKTYFVPPEAIIKVPLRRPPKVTQNIRLVEIEGFDYSACGGTHCTRTGEMGILKIIKNERINNKTRIYFWAGLQALSQFRAYHTVVNNIASMLSTNAKELSSAFRQHQADYKSLQKKNQELQQQNIAYEAELLISKSQSVKNNQIVIASYTDRPTHEIRLLAEILKEAPKTISVIFSFTNGRISIIVTSGNETDISAKLILQQLLFTINGKGGGDDQIAQGGGAINPEQSILLTSTAWSTVQKLV